MNLKKAIPYFILVAVASLLFFIRRCQHESNQKNGLANENSVNRNHGFDRRISFLEYTRHAKCRMDCRMITEDEIKKIMQSGQINYRKSDIKDKPCPTYAVEGKTEDNQKIRVVFAQCDEKTKVVTVIDISKEWQCDCPGDDKKYQNRN
ncbi:MAG: hypothetical protein C4308_04735 [Chitinophagaceae bacterium]